MSAHNIPSLIGGFEVRRYDLVPAILFAVAYGLLVPPLIYRASKRNSRTAVVFELLAFVIERVVVFCLRAVCASNPSRQSIGLSEYLQAALALEFIAIAQITGKIVRTIFVNSTNPPAEDEPAPELDAKLSLSTSSSTFPTPNTLIKTHSSEFLAARGPSSSSGSDERRRFTYRRLAEVQFLFLYLPALVTGIVASQRIYGNAERKMNHAMWALRFASTSMGLVLVLWQVAALATAKSKVPGVDMRAVRLMLGVTSLLLFPPIYRLCVMGQTTDDIQSPTHAALNTSLDKVGFYVVHILPEYLSVALMTVFNVKEICNLGWKGDFRSRDEKPEERTKRWEKERKRREKRAEKRRMKELRKQGIVPEQGMELAPAKGADAV
ncbi:hypothetical protein MKEN_00800100 [Mycena kentingensis (nom. inval.)]|nr:hypothetical protein MKEN_00800100 [Mycena kentingensis (nom. inval.)]